MRNYERQAARTLFLILLAGALGASAASGDDDRRQKQPDVDIESLKSEIRLVEDGWLLQIRYDVEIEHYRRGDAYELAVRLTDHDYDVTDREGHPLVFVIPLDRPTDIDDKELEFESGTTIRLPLGAIRDPGHLRLHGDVYGVGDDQSLDHKSKSVKYDKPRRVRCGVGVGIGVGYGVSVGVHVRL